MGLSMPYGRKKAALPTCPNIACEMKTTDEMITDLSAVGITPCISVRNLGFWLLVPILFAYALANAQSQQKQNSPQGSAHNVQNVPPTPNTPASEREGRHTDQDSSRGKRKTSAACWTRLCCLGVIVNLTLAAATLVIAIFGVIQARATKVAAEAAKVSAEVLKPGTAWYW
jgi:hypothetical protein